MEKIRLAVIVVTVFAVSIMAYGAGTASGAEDVGAVVALKGTALIEREAKIIEAKLKDRIQLKDIVETRDRTKAKMLFIDDSVLTMGEKSKVVIKEFLYSKDKGGRSIFNLIDGKMRSVVGKSDIEIHTPTAVAAARGTVFDCETGESIGKLFTTCTCFVGEVDIRGIDPTMGRVTLRPGMTVTVMSGQPIPAPTPTPTLQPAGMSPLPLTQAPPISQQPSTKNTTPVTIGVKLP